jgi:hypothetical protein
VTVWLWILSAAPAGELIEGERLSLAYNDAGTWNDSAIAQGFRARLGPDWVEFTYAGLAFQMVAVAYSHEGTAEDYYNASFVGQELYLLSSEDSSADGRSGITHLLATPEIEIEEQQSFTSDSSVVRVSYLLTNSSAAPVSNVRILFAFDPDQEVAISSDSTYYNTQNDTLDLDGDGTADWTQSVGFESGYTVGIGACTPSNSELGHYAEWQSVYSTDVTLLDAAGAEGDTAMAIRYSLPAALEPGESTAFSFVISVADSAVGAQAGFSGGTDECCDADGDGAENTACGGEDCDDAQPENYPGATEVAYDGIDQDCNGADLADVDGDGANALAAGGTDCDDDDVEIGPTIPEIWYDGIDQNCDGNDDDQDLDGWVLAYDCDDEDSSIYANCPEGDGGDAKGTGGVDASAGCDCQTAGRNAGGGGAGIASAIGAVVSFLRRRTKHAHDRRTVGH